MPGRRCVSSPISGASPSGAGVGVGDAVTVAVTAGVGDGVSGARAAALGAAPGDCFVIEDSYNGIRAAAAAGMRPLMVPDMVPPDEEMERLAEGIFPDLAAAGRYLTGALDD